MTDPTIEPLTIAPKQLEGLELCRRKKFVLFSGPRKCLKTVNSLIAICDHAWNIPHAEIVAITVSQSAGLEAGIWDKLVDGILPRYMALGQGMEWKKKPYTSAVSKKPACIVTNKFGGQARIQLDSLKDERDVEKRFKTGKDYTLMYVPELSNYVLPKTFDIWAECLRSMHRLTPEQFLFLADTNPPDDGDDSWFYKKWFILRTQEYSDYCVYQAEQGLPIASENAFNALKSNLGLLTFEIADNCFITQAEVDELVARHSHDQDLYDRYILGKYVKASTHALFAKHFRENIHVAGELETPGNPDPMMLVPQDSTWKLYISMDPGTSANSAGYIFEKVTLDLTGGRKSLPIFPILDEAAIIAEDHTIEDFTLMLCEKMFWWEQYCDRIFEWQAWSDRSVFEQRENLSKKYYHQLIFEIAARFWQKKFDETGIAQYATRTIALQAADRTPGSLKHRVDLSRRLMFENRILVSRTRCPKLIQCFKSMPSAKNDPDVPPKGHYMKHAFDGCFYGVAEESYDEATSAIFRTLRNQRGRSESGLVSIKA